MNLSAIIVRKMHVGRRPILLEKNVEILIKDDLVKQQNFKITDFVKYVEIKGPLGILGMHVPPGIAFKTEETQQEGEKILKLSLNNDFEVLSKRRKEFVQQFYGLTNGLLRSFAIGVFEGHTTFLKLVGVGYRVVLEKELNRLNLKLGFSHPVYVTLEEGIEVTIPAPNKIVLFGIDKQKINQFAAKIRKLRKPEPYKGKGIFVNDEKIQRIVTKKK